MSNNLSKDIKPPSPVQVEAKPVSLDDIQKAIGHPDNKYAFPYGVGEIGPLHIWLIDAKKAAERVYALLEPLPTPAQVEAKPEQDDHIKWLEKKLADCSKLVKTYSDNALRCQEALREVATSSGNEETLRTMALEYLEELAHPAKLKIEPSEAYHNPDKPTPQQEVEAAAESNKWMQLRAKFFAECVEHTPSGRRISFAPYDLFEWFKKQWQASQQ